MSNAPDLRHEVKMVGPAAFLPAFRAHLRLHPFAFSVLFPPRRVNNIYLDSQDLSRLNQNYAGVSRRCKVRYRWYGDTSSPDKGVVEFKQKRAALGWKESFPVNTPLALHRISWDDFFAVLRQSVPPEAWLAMHNLNRPVLINRYYREYYTTPDRELRLTVDSQQMFFSQWNTVAPNLVFSTVPLAEMVVEIKASASAEDRIAEVLGGFPLQRGKNSKYVAGTERLTGLR